MRSKIKIAVVDDHALFRNGMIALLKNYPSISVSFDACNGIEFFEKLEKRKQSPDVLLLDLDMPEMDGFAVLKKLNATGSPVKPLIITMHNEDELIYELVRLGAKGFLQKNADVEEVVNAIHTLHSGEIFFNNDVSKRVIKNLVKKEHIKTLTLNNALSEREKEIIRHICQELTTKEISDRLFISERTVEAHKQHIFEKTKSRNAAGIVTYAFRTGLVQ
jgi:two-component system, NarL family, response regulator DegU